MNIVRFLIIGLAVFGMIACKMDNKPSTKTKPNVIILLADDLGWVDLSTDKTNLGNGSDYYQTPNIDALADRGISLSSMYACQNCAPSRAALMSGQYAPRTKVYNVHSLDRGDENSLIKPINNLHELNADLITIAETFKKAGYVTSHFGKWGIGNRNIIETEHGFDISYCSAITKVAKKITTGYYPEEDENGNLQFSMYSDMKGSRTSAFTSPYSQEYVDKYLKPYANGNNPDLLVGTRKHLTDAMADATEDFLSKTRYEYGEGKPFFMYVAFNQVHVPVEPRLDLEEKYKHIESTDPRHNNKQFAPFIEQLDQVVARILDQLKDPNGDGKYNDDLSNNTIVIFTSDNGGLGGQFTSNAPLKGWKGMQSEGGIRVPFIAYFPKYIEGGKTSEVLGHFVDIYPTLADLADVSLPDESIHLLDGHSLKSALCGGSDVNHPVFGHFPGYMDNRSVPCSYVIGDVDKKRYKLFFYYDKQEYEFYCLSDDISESKNLMEDNENKDAFEIARKLKKELSDWLIKMNPEPITYRENGERVPGLGPL